MQHVDGAVLIDILCLAAGRCEQVADVPLGSLLLVVGVRSINRIESLGDPCRAALLVLGERLGHEDRPLNRLIGPTENPIEHFPRGRDVAGPRPLDELSDYGPEVLGADCVQQGSSQLGHTLVVGIALAERVASGEPPAGRVSAVIVRR